MNHKIRAQVLIVGARFTNETHKGWKTWACDIDPKRYTLENGRSMAKRIQITVPPEQEIEPIVGDQMELIMINPQTWMPSTTPFTGSVADYTRNVSEKHEMEIDGVKETLYRFPDFANMRFFEVKPVVCYYNPITGVQFCETVNTNRISLNDHPDQIIWSVYERGFNNEIHVVGDWASSREATRVFNWLTSTLKVMKKLKE